MKPHRTDGISLSFGLIFLLAAFWWAVAKIVTVPLPQPGWLVAGVLILFGTIGLLGAIRGGRRAEVPAPVAAEAEVETPGDLPPEMHADIVRELLSDPVHRIDLVPDPTAAQPVPSAPPVAQGGPAVAPGGPAVAPGGPAVAPGGPTAAQGGPSVASGNSEASLEAGSGEGAGGDTRPDLFRRQD
ncbi:hypothetical protein [Couchioplanes caeruleus]|uniref:Uncharacterized protein n=1 Tax=Couchioplanes caeruleus TaxID=56438 RepID=A0A3N1GIR2_9ACTN|nr:hypothetical protein [Couchioplanes caeruleus]ROP30160.1 hypothetical protein EDD30_2994 [Couchioplanes caeruleus]